MVGGAIADFNKAIELDPNHAEVYYNRGSAKAELQDYYTGAIEDYTKAIELDPNHAEVYYNRGITKKELGNFNGYNADMQEYKRLRGK